MTKAGSQRDRAVTKAVHSLFWRALMDHPFFLAATYCLQVPTYFTFNIFIPLEVAYGIQATIARRPDLVAHQARIVLFVTVFGAVMYAAGTWFNHRLNVLSAAAVQRRVFANYLNKDYEFYSSRYIGALGNDATSLRTVFQDYALLATFDVPKALVIILGGLTVITYKSVALGLVSTLCVFLVIGIAVYISMFRLKYRREVSRASSYLSAMIGDPLSHVPAVKSFAQEKHEEERLEKPLKVWQRAQLKIFDTSIPHMFVRHIGLAITMAVLLVVSANLYQKGAISVAIVALVQLYIIRVVNTTIEIGEIIKEYENLMSDTYEPMATMLVETTVKDRQKTETLDRKHSYDIDFNKVTYHYPESMAGSLAVNNFSLHVSNGEKIGLVGYSGGGKTTITKLLLRFMDIDKGSITIDGVDIRDLSQYELRNLISYVPQEPLLFHRSINDNIAYSKPKATHKEIVAAAHTAFVDEFVNDLPENYQSMVGERGVKLSGGQRQRVAIARAILKDAPILLLDEATSALDSKSEQYIQKALWRLMEGRTAIVIAHRLSTIQKMDRIVVLDNGKIAQMGTHNELLNDTDGIYAGLWARQSGGYLAGT